MIKIKNGLNIPICGSPCEVIDESKKINYVAVIGDDYIGMKPSMLVEVGQNVKIGQKLFENKKRPGVFITSPGSGEVIAINRGDKRAFINLVIKLSSNEDYLSYEGMIKNSYNQMSEEEIKSVLIESGMWCAFRSRPFDKTPAIGECPHSIFVTAMDSNPLGFDPELIISKYEDSFYDGVRILKKLTRGKIFVCTKRNSRLSFNEERISKEEFCGPHPSGNPGTHIHFMDPVSENKRVWHIHYQDVIALSKLFNDKKLWVDRYVSLAGPMSRNPRILKTRMGAYVDDLISGEVIKLKETRIISGSILNGRGYYNEPAYLGRFHHQISLLKEGNQRELFGWAMPGLNKYSVTNSFLSKLVFKKDFAFTTNLNGQHRNIVPFASYEKVLPGDFLATNLLKSIMSKDIEDAINLGCLELAEEDLALCTYVCPSKNDFGKHLRELLELIEKEG